MSDLHNHDLRPGTQRLMRTAAKASVAVALILVASKLYVWVMSSSAALLGSLTDSGLDLLSSLVTFFAVRVALEPADADHRFGHGKAEALAGLFQSGLMGASALFLLGESLGRILHPEPLAHADLVAGVSILALVLTAVLVGFQMYVIRHTQSLAIKGDHLHYKGDLLMNVGVVVSAWLASGGYPVIDGVAGALIALYIAYSAYGIVRPAVDQLMDREFPEEERERICNLVLEGRGVRGLHELKTRTSGQTRFIQMHVEVAAGITIEEGHLIAHELEATIGEIYPAAEVIIHIDPPSGEADKLTIKELGKLES